MKFKMVTIGSAVLDIFMLSEHYDDDANAVIEFNIGKKIEIPDIVVSSGGGATNAAATYTALGLKTTTINRIGNDHIGAIVLDDLKKRKINTQSIIVDERGHTAVSVILSALEKGRTVLVHRGTSAAFHDSDFPLRVFKQSRWVHLSSIGNRLAVLKRIAEYAKRGKTNVAWNPGTKELAFGMKRLAPLIEVTKVLNINKEESDQLLGKKTPIRTALKKIHAIANSIVVITDGKRGSTAIGEDGKIVHAGIHSSITPLERTGSGDAFLSGFIASLIRMPDDLSYALQVGTANAESVIQKVGAKNGILRSWPRKGLVRVTKKA